MEGSTEAQSVVSPTKTAVSPVKNAVPEEATEEMQRNGVEDVVSTNGNSDAEQKENIEDEALTGKKRKSIEGDSDLEIECKRIKSNQKEDIEEVTKEITKEVTKEEATVITSEENNETAKEKIEKLDEEQKGENTEDIKEVKEISEGVEEEDAENC